MSTEAISQTSIDDFVERVNRLYNRSQKLRDNMMEFGQRWSIDLNQDAEPTVTTTTEQNIESQPAQAAETNVHVEPTIQPAQAVAEEPVNAMDNHDDIDLDSLIEGIKFSDEELAL